MPRVKFCSIASYSGEDRDHPVTNLLEDEVSKKKWLCKRGDPFCSVVLQLTHSVQIETVTVGAHAAALVEVLVGRSENSHSFEVLVPGVNFLNMQESRRNECMDRVRTFTKEHFAEGVRDQKWDRVRVMCKQPYNRHLAYGLSFVHVFESGNHRPSVQPSPVSLQSLDDCSSDEEQFKPGILFATYMQTKNAGGGEGSSSSSAESQIRRATSQALKNIPGTSTQLVKTPRANKDENVKDKASSSKDDGGNKRDRNNVMYENDDSKPNAKIDRIVRCFEESKKLAKDENNEQSKKRESKTPRDDSKALDKRQSKENSEKHEGKTSKVDSEKREGKTSKEESEKREGKTSKEESEKRQRDKSVDDRNRREKEKKNESAKREREKSRDNLKAREKRQSQEDTENPKREKDKKESENRERDKLKDDCKARERKQSKEESERLERKKYKAESDKRDKNKNDLDKSEKDKAKEKTGKREREKIIESEKHKRENPKEGSHRRKRKNSSDYSSPSESTTSDDDSRPSERKKSKGESRKSNSDISMEESKIRKGETYEDDAKTSERKKYKKESVNMEIEISKEESKKRKREKSEDDSKTGERKRTKEQSEKLKGETSKIESSKLMKHKSTDDSVTGESKKNKKESDEQQRDKFKQESERRDRDSKRDYRKESHRKRSSDSSNDRGQNADSSSSKKYKRLEKDRSDKVDDRMRKESRSDNKKRADRRSHTPESDSGLKAGPVSSTPHTLMSEVAFTISGYENPRRADVRSKALAMGARYERHWTSGCTHLICAFPNTPKLKEVRALPNGSSYAIVKADWVEECCNLRRLLPWQWHATEPSRRITRPEDWETVAGGGDYAGGNRDDDSEMDTDDEIERVIKQQNQNKPSTSRESGNDSPKNDTSKNSSPKNDTSKNSSPKNDTFKNSSPKNRSDSTHAKGDQGAKRFESDGEKTDENISSRVDVELDDKTLLPNFFDGCVFAVDQSIANSPDVNRLSRYICAYGGLVTKDREEDTPTEVHYIISSCRGDPEVETKPLLVTPDWVVRCHDKRRKCSTKNY